jgi:hypothetical protein
MRHETQGAEAIVDGDDDDALLHQLRCIVVVAFAHEQRPAMDPEHDRVVLAVVVGREYVEEQAILVQGAVAELRQRLGTVAAEPGRIDGPRRTLGSLRRPPAQRSDRRGGIPNTKKLAHGAGRIQRTLKRAVGGRYQS